MNRRAFLTGLIATTALAPCAIAQDAILATAPAQAWEAYFEQWIKDANTVMVQVWEDQIIYGTGAWVNIDTYPYVARVDPRVLLPPTSIGGLLNR